MAKPPYPRVLDGALVCRLLGALVVGLLTPAAPVRAQTPSSPAAPAAVAPAPRSIADTLQSPEVHPDGKVTFRLYAPRATEVAVAGEWSRPGAPPNTPQPLARGSDGVWSVTLGPLEPNIYIHVFKVDGLTIPDPVNPLMKLRARTSASLLEIPGDRPWRFRDVPHGTLHTHTFAAASLGGAARTVVVYTPPGYERSTSSRYPVLYLLHGNNDLEVGWTMAGRAHLILDNQIADRRTVPMIVVMPWGHALPFGSRPAPDQPSNNDKFEQHLLSDVIPLIESRYRVAPGRARRAIVGLSMGGAQALQIALQHPQRFGALGLFGAGMTGADFDRRYGTHWPASDGGKKPPARFAPLFVGVGKEDGVLGRTRELTQALRARGLDVIHEETDGGHTYPVWRQLLVKTAPLLFR